MEALWRSQAQASPLRLTVACTGRDQKPQSTLAVRSRRWHKTLEALSVEVKHFNQTLYKGCCTSAKRSKNTVKISNAVRDTIKALYVTVIKRFV